VIPNPFAEPARRVILAMMILFSAATHGQQPSQADAAVVSPDRFAAMQTSVLDQERVVDAMRTMYVAATNDDLALFHSVAAPGFYAYDLGKRFKGDELMALIRSRHEAGVVYVWRVTEPEVHIDGDTAWITYVNRGSITDASGAKEVTWLESAVLQKEKDGWRIQFFHSTRVP
jgi:ketosteroid isomerase-like protein